MIRVRRNLLGPIAVAAVLLSLSAGTVSAATVLDQETAPAGGTVSSDPTHNWQQSFKQVNNNITHAAVLLPFDPGTVTLEVLDGLCGTILATASTTVPASGWVQVDFGGPVALVPEQTYYLRAFSTVLMAVAAQNPPYTRGLLHWRNDSGICEPFIFDSDLAFRTYADDQFGPTPVEATTWSGVKALYR